MLLSPKLLRFDRKGLSLVELMVVVLIIGILAAVLGGAIVKWMAWQRDPTNPNSNVSLTINNIRQAVQRVIQDIQQKARQDYQALSLQEKSFFQSLAVDLSARNVPNQNFVVLAEPEPTNKNLLVFSNAKIAKQFPVDASKIGLFQNQANVNSDFSVAKQSSFYAFDFNMPIISLPSGVTLKDATIYPSNGTYPIMLPVQNSNYYSNYFLTMDFQTRKKTVAIENSIYKAFASVNGPIPSSPTRMASACLLWALENHPKGLKAEDLGAGIVSEDASGARFIQPGGIVVYHKLHYVDSNDFSKDKSYKVGSLRVDIDYDQE